MCIRDRGTCIYDAFDEYNATANATTSEKYDSYGETNGFNYLWYYALQYAGTNGRGYYPLGYAMNGWESYWNFQLTSNSESKW